VEDDRREHDRDRLTNADEIKAEWDRALDAASLAVGASSRAGTLGQSDLAAESQLISDERQWLSGFLNALRRLFP
jgi:hypothetical protein